MEALIAASTDINFRFLEDGSTVLFHLCYAYRALVVNNCTWRRETGKIALSMKERNNDDNRDFIAFLIAKRR
ncbi:hypothetical protein DL770_007100 [Monosporascus sp. CRB-9-2]|nr:hypothetical protein DL770_007100 [Monosporascus sp. CRB-9-2]